MGEDRYTPKEHRYTVAEAADILGITTGAVRNRLSRGTLRSTKFAGTVYVLLPDDMSRGTERDVDDTPPGMSSPDREAELVDELRDRVAFLQRELERRSSEAERYQQIIARLSQTNAEQARTIRAIEAPAPQEPTEAAETVEEEQEDAEQPWWSSPADRLAAEPVVVPEATEQEEAILEEEPLASKSMESISGDGTLSNPQEPPEVAMGPGPVENQESALAEADIAKEEVQQERAADTLSDGQEEAEGSRSVEDKREDHMVASDQEQERQEQFQKWLRQRQAAHDAEVAALRAAEAARRPWWRRLFGGR